MLRLGRCRLGRVEGRRDVKYNVAVDDRSKDDAQRRRLGDGMLALITVVEDEQL